MGTFLAFYRGDTRADAKLVAVTVDPAIVAEFAQRILAHPQPATPDPVLREVERGHRRALRLIAREGVAVAGAEGGAP